MNDPTGNCHLSIVIPAYNEERRLPFAVQELTRFASEQSYACEIVVVENGSTDRTFEVARGAAAADGRIRALRSERRGKGLAVRTGMLGARGRYRFLCDADLSMPAREIPRFLPPSIPDPEVVIASREATGAVVHGEPYYRRFVGRWFNRLVRWLVLPGLRDTQCGFKCFRADVAETVFGLTSVEGMAFDAEVLAIARLKGYRIDEVPIHWYWNADSRVRLFVDSWLMACDLLRIRSRLRDGSYER